nr:hypothetical protein [Methanobacterium formicicum]
MDDDLIRDNPGKESTEISEEDAENLEIPRGTTQRLWKIIDYSITWIITKKNWLKAL